MWVLGFCVNLGVISLLYKIRIEGKFEFWSGDEIYLDKHSIVRSGGRASARDVAALYSPVNPGELKQARRHHNILGKLDQRKIPYLYSYVLGVTGSQLGQTKNPKHSFKASALNQCS